MAMGNNCAFALVAGGGFRGPPPRLPVVIIESLLSSRGRPSLSLSLSLSLCVCSAPASLSSRVTRMSYKCYGTLTLSSSRSRVLLFGALSILESTPSVYPGLGHGIHQRSIAVRRAAASEAALTRRLLELRP